MLLFKLHAFTDLDTHTHTETQLCMTECVLIKLAFKQPVCLSVCLSLTLILGCEVSS